MDKLIFANWKSQKLVSQIEPWVVAVGAPPAGVSVIVMAPFSLLGSVGSQLPVGIGLGAQDVSPFPLGAYTGEIAAAQLADMKVTHCLAGHSERRKYFAETSEQVAKKCEQLLQVGITPVVCVDEPYLEEQLGLLSAEVLKACVIAYEPLSAIGTGDNAPLDVVRTMVEKIKQLADVPVIYGGSVTSDSIGEYLLVCDGALVGSASLDGSAFAKLLAVAAAKAPSFA